LSFQLETDYLILL